MEKTTTFDPNVLADLSASDEALKKELTAFVAKGYKGPELIQVLVLQNIGPDQTEKILNILEKEVLGKEWERPRG